MKIIPAPQKTQIMPGICQLPKSLSVFCDKPAQPAVGILIQRADTLFDSKQKIVFNNQNAFISITKIKKTGKCGGYNIKIEPKGIAVTYNDDEGASNACATLFHLVRNAAADCDRLKCAEIEDFPVYKHRGLHLDTARHYFEPAEIKKIIEHISLLKMNVLHWHFADDQAWRLESKAYPMLTNYCAEKFYTQETVKEIVSYASARGVNIIPEIEIPGHSSAAIAAYPELSCEGRQINVPQTGGIFKTILCAGKQETYKFIEKIINEVCDIFPSSIIHLGGDEAPKIKWQGCPCCAEKMEEESIEDFEQLQGYMLNFANSLLKQRGRSAVCWNDCLKCKNLDKDIIVQYWVQSTAKSYCKLNDKRRYIFSNLLPFYLDYPHSVNNLKNIYRYTPKIKNDAFKDTSRTEGIECTVWTERIETNEKLEYMIFPRCAAVAEISWSKARNYYSFKCRLKDYYEYWMKTNVMAAEISEAEVKGTKRAAENVKFVKTMSSVMVKVKKEENSFK